MAHYAQLNQEREIQTLEVGDTFTTVSRVVSQVDAEFFENAVGLTHPLFLSDEYAQSQGFKGRLVTGVFTFGLLMGLLYQAGLIRRGVFLGIEKARFPNPVRAGDSLGAEVEILNKRSTSKGGRVIVTYKWTLKNQNGEVAAEGENTCMFPAVK